MTAGGGLAIAAAHGEVRLKWHQLRRRAGDLPFDRDNLRRALTLGACCEVDLRRAVEPRFALLHDAELDAETTGTGPVAVASAAMLEGLRYRHPRTGQPGHRLLFLDEVTAMLGADASSLHDRAVMQLDLKEEDAERLTDALLEGFAGAASGCASRLTVGGFSWPAVERLAGAAPGIAKGFDPLRLALDRKPGSAAEFGAFVAAVRAVAPDAAIVYLHHEIVARARAAGAAIVDDFHSEGVAVDCWTLDPGLDDFALRLETAVAAGVDRITTNAPLALERCWRRRTGAP